MSKPLLGKVLGPKAGIQLGIFFDFKKNFFSLHPNEELKKTLSEFEGQQMKQSFAEIIKQQENVHERSTLKKFNVKFKPKITLNFLID